MTLPNQLGYDDTHDAGFASAAFAVDAGYAFVVPVDTYATHVEFVDSGGGASFAGTHRVGITDTLLTPLTQTFLDYADITYTGVTGGVRLRVALVGGHLLLTGGVTYYLLGLRTAGSNQNVNGQDSPTNPPISADTTSAGYGLYTTGGGTSWHAALPNYRLGISAYADGTGPTPPAVLAIAATDEGDGTVTLDVTDAAHPGSVVYNSDFTAGVDSWTSGTDGGGGSPTLTGVTASPGGTLGLKIGTAAGTKLNDTDQWVRRSITGLTSGHNYRIQLTCQFDPASFGYQVIRVGKTGDLDPGTSMSEYAPTTVTYDVAATSTTLVVELRTGTEPLPPVYNYPIVYDVTVTDLGTGDLEALQIQRTDDNGTHYVRLEAGAVPDGTGALTVVDNEAALTGTVTYVVRDGDGDTASTTISLDVPTPLLSTVGYLATLDVDRVDGYEASRRYQVVSQDSLAIVGRGDPLVTDRGDATWSLREGTLTFAPQPSYAEALAIVDVYTRGRVTMLRQATHPGLDLYHVGTDIHGPTPHYLKDTWMWSVSVDFTEVIWPAGDLAGTPGWTWADVTAGYLAWWNVVDAYTDWADLLVGP